MTLENILSQMGIGTKQLTDRYSEYGAPVHDHHVHYAFEHPSSHGYVSSSKHSYSGSHKGNAAMSALTLLAFLFFLHILQQCVKDHINDMNNAPIMVMTAGREGDENISKSAVANKIDKTGIQEPDANEKSEKDKTVMENNFANPGPEEQAYKEEMTKINVAEHVPLKYKYVFKNQSSAFPEFRIPVRATDDVDDY